MKNKQSKQMALFAILVGVGLPVVVRLVTSAGYVPTRDGLMVGTMGLGMVCIVGGLMAYRAAMAQNRKYQRGEYDTDG